MTPESQPPPPSKRGYPAPVLDEPEPAGRQRKKKPWRYRWPDDVRDEVLARLLALDQERTAGARPPKETR